MNNSEYTGELGLHTRLSLLKLGVWSVTLLSLHIERAMQSPVIFHVGTSRVIHWFDGGQWSHLVLVGGNDRVECWPGPEEAVQPQPQPD